MKKSKITSNLPFEIILHPEVNKNSDSLEAIRNSILEAFPRYVFLSREDNATGIVCIDDDSFEIDVSLINGGEDKIEDLDISLQIYIWNCLISSEGKASITGFLKDIGIDEVANNYENAHNRARHLIRSRLYIKIEDQIGNKDESWNSCNLDVHLIPSGSDTNIIVTPSDFAVSSLGVGGKESVH